MTFTYWLVISFIFSHGTGGSGPIGPFFSEKACQESFEHTKVLQDINGNQGPTMYYTCVPMPTEGD